MLPKKLNFLRHFLFYICIKRYLSCKTCEHHWYDFPMPLDHYESHCEIVDERVGWNKMDEVVQYPCLECPFNSYSKKKD